MKILILTQVMDKTDPVLGFFHRWVLEFAGQCEKVSVVCLQKGECDLPENVKVFSLGKESQPSRLRYLFNFFKYIFKLRDDYDVVFVHMNYEYVLLGGVWWRLMSKKIGLWYAHGKVSRGLKLAEWFTDIVFTSTHEGFRLESDKKIVVGQGIDTSLFIPAEVKSEKIFTIVSVGRISRVKNYELLIEAIRELDVPCVVKIIGGPLTSTDREYEALLTGKILAYHLEEKVTLTGSRTQAEIIPELQQADLFVNMSETGSLDKAVLEAMSCGTPVLTSNEAVATILEAQKTHCVFAKGDKADFLEKIKTMMNLTTDERKHLSEELRDIVVQEHQVGNLINRILHTYGK